MSEAPEKDEIDQLMESLEAPAEERPMTSGETSEEAPAAEPQWNGKEWEFESNGRKIFPDSKEKARTWMSQGHSYSQRMAEINQQRQAWEREKAELSKYKEYSKYKEVDDFARSNKDWWEHVERAYQTRNAQNQVDPSLDQLIRPLREELNETKSFISQLQQERQEQEVKRQNEALDTEIKSIRESHPNIDLDSKDESGKTLELRVLEHCSQIGTTSFRAGFRDYLHDQLVESAKAGSLAAKTKEEQVKKERGILGTSPTPRKVSNGPVNVRGRSWDEVSRMAMEEAGIT